jgi:hypothetical protein
MKKKGAASTTNGADGHILPVTPPKKTASDASVNISISGRRMGSIRPLDRRRVGP